ncbi:MAG: hypothetical protein WCG91_00790 [Candidatus Shapirobacteria bacterium]
MKKLGIAKFLVMALVLGGGLIYGTQMVQKNQENRSKAANEITTQDGPCGSTANVCLDGRPATNITSDAVKNNWKCPYNGGFASCVLIKPGECGTKAYGDCVAGKYQNINGTNTQWKCANVTCSIPKTAIPKGPCGSTANVCLNGGSATNITSDAVKSNWKCPYNGGLASCILIKPGKCGTKSYGDCISGTYQNINGTNTQWKCANVTCSMPKVVTAPKGPCSTTANKCVDGRPATNITSDAVKNNWKCPYNGGFASCILIKPGECGIKYGNCISGKFEKINDIQWKCANVTCSL